jgi:hypothetical protein
MTLQKIKEEYAKEQGSDDWSTFEADEEIHFDIDNLLRSVWETALKEASEKTPSLFYKNSYGKLTSGVYADADVQPEWDEHKQSILETPLD